MSQSDPVRYNMDEGVIYTDGERAIITFDGLGLYFGEGDDPVFNLKDEYGVDEVENLNVRAMNRLIEGGYFEEGEYWDEYYTENDDEE